MLELIEVEKFIENAHTWFNENVWTTSTMVQIVIILSALIVAGVIKRLTNKKLTEIINSIQFPPQGKRILHSMRRLVFPFAVLVMMLVAVIIDSMITVPGSLDLIKAALSLAVAWVVIRLLLQVISNSFVRNILALVIWGIAALSILGILDQTATLLDSLGVNIGDFRLSALTIIKGMIALFALLYVAMLASSLVERQIKGVQGLTISSKVLLSKIIRVALITCALLIGITSAGIDLSLFAVFGGAIGLGIGFGLQKGISNLFSGMLLLLDKSIKPGDIIELPNGSFGWVEKMGARYTEIVTRDNKSFLIPNEDFITQQVVNWSHENTLIRVEVEFGVHYDSDPHQVKAVAEKAAGAPDRIVSTPKPVCHLVELGDSSLNFKLRFWIEDAEAGVTNTKGAVMLALWDAFKENDIRIPYPHREIFIHENKS